MNYLCKESWKRHTKGDVITDWEYKKLPIEIKKHFELIEEVKFERQEVGGNKFDFVVNQEKPTIVGVNVSQNPFSPKKKKVDAVADIDSLLKDEAPDMLDTK